MNALKVILLILGIMVLAQVNDWPFLNQLVVALVGLLIVAYVWSRLSLRSVSITRETSTDRSQVGQPVAERIELRNRGWFPKLWLEVRDYSTLPVHQASRVVHVRGRGRTEWRVETLCVRRGRYRVGPLMVRSGDPFGLFPRSMRVPGSHELIVYPATVDVSRFSLPRGNISGGKATPQRNPFVTPSIAGVRDYTTGDAFNRISWAATARLGKLMIKEFDFDPSADVWLVLDLEQTQHRAAGEVRAAAAGPDGMGLHGWLDSTAEYAVTIAASLARRCLDEGRSVGLIASGGFHEVIPADRSDRQYIKILETLAVVRADGNRPLAEVLMLEGGRFGRQSGLIAITPSTDEAWVAAMVGIVGRQVPAAAIVVEPATFAPADGSLLVVSGLVAAGIPTHLVKHGDDIGIALSSTHGSGSPVGGRTHDG